MSENLSENMLTCILPPEQMAEVLAAESDDGDPANTSLSKLAVSAALDRWSQTLFLVLADRSIAIVPLSTFRANPVLAPDFSCLELDDHGHTIRFGEYEAATDAALGCAVFSEST